MIPASARAQFVVVVPEKSPVDSLSLNELRMVFKGFSIDTDQKTPFRIVDFDPVSNDYYNVLYGAGADTMAKYWLRLIFTSNRVLPPKNFSNAHKLKTFIETHDDAIGFLPLSLFEKIKGTGIRALIINGRSYHSELYLLTQDLSLPSGLSRQ
ncbi:MAG: hypothetical protein ACE5IR_20710 [bacterium]